ncbi:hypothetical protein V1512DRAFT_256063 [Lipomyces arxii]|uniref:uncharacterized protein n=1 Tax=Lipomyces arxii TaxID=56418 RepID=UPI0034CE4FA5
MKEELYCICRKPDQGQWMIACDICDNWYHGKCVHIDEQDADLLDTYACPNCTSKGGKTLWKRKCLLPECRLPALVGKSKYCCVQHGVKYMTDVIAAHRTDSDDGLHNAALSPNDIAALISIPFSEFKALGDSLPPDTVKSLTTLDHARLASLASLRQDVNAKMHYATAKSHYASYAKLRAQATKLCGFDPKLVLDDHDWIAFVDSQDGKSVLDRISSYLDSHPYEPDRRRQKRKPLQPESDAATQDILAVLPTGTEGMCELEKRRCSKHNAWQHIRTEEIELDLRECADALDKIDKEEAAIAQRAIIRSLKDSVHGGKCILVTSSNAT